MTAKVAIVAQADSLILEAIVDAWSDSSLIDTGILLVSPMPTDETLSVDGRTLAFDDIDSFDFESVQCVLVLCPALIVEAYQSVLQALHCPVLGFWDDLQCLSPQRWERVSSHACGVFGFLPASVEALQYVLDGIGVESLDIPAIYSASVFGRAGVAELAAQTTRLLNMQAVDATVFTQELPFNYFPIESGVSGEGAVNALRDGVVQAFSLDDVHVRALQAPVFYGVTLLVSAILEEEVNIDAFLARLAGKELISYQDSVKLLSNRAVLDENGNILLGALQKNISDEYRLDFWLGIDDVKFSAVNSFISAAEFLLKHHL